MKILYAFHQGGWLMYPILVLFLALVLVSLERFYVLFFKSRLDKEFFFKTLQNFLLKSDFEGMITVCDQNPAPLARVVKQCLVRLVNKGTDDEIQSALDEGAMIEVPIIERRISFLSVVGNVSTLLGLLGTITGLIACFASIANSDPSTKAQELTRGISEAMNCTAFGLFVAIPSILLYYLFQARAQRIIDDLNEVSIRTFNFILANRSRFGIENKAA